MTKRDTQAAEYRAEVGWKWTDDETHFATLAARVRLMGSQFITEMFGERCSEFEPFCDCCQRWMLLDELLATPFCLVTSDKPTLLHLLTEKARERFVEITSLREMLESNRTLNHQLVADKAKDHKRIKELERQLATVTAERDEALKHLSPKMGDDCE
jgi:hypothetical protein